MGQHHGLELGRRHRTRWQDGIVGNNHRSVCKVSIGQAVRSFDQRRAANRSYVQEVSESQLARKQTPGNSELGRHQCRIKEQLHWIIARLAVNIDCSGEVGRLCIVEPQ